MRWMSYVCELVEHSFERVFEGVVEGLDLGEHGEAREAVGVGRGRLVGFRGREEGLDLGYQVCHFWVACYGSAEDGQTFEWMLEVVYLLRGLILVVSGGGSRAGGVEYSKICMYVHGIFTGMWTGVGGSYI